MARRTASTDNRPLAEQIATIKFGIEIEAFGLGIREAASIVSRCFGVPVQHGGAAGYLDRHFVTSEDGREWSVVRDASVSGGFEFVTPPCTVADVEKIQEIVRAFRRAGAYTTAETGMHIHVEAIQGERGTGLNTPAAVKRFASMLFAREELIVKAFEASDRSRSNWCRLLPAETIARLNRRGADSDLNGLCAAWYNRHGFSTREATYLRHYDASRYHGINLHSLFNRGATVELRYFHSPIKHAGKMRAQLLFVLALVAKARNGRAATAKKVEIAHGNEKYALRSYMLKLGMSGDYWKVCREHLLKPLAGNANRARPVAAASAA